MKRQVGVILWKSKLNPNESDRGFLRDNSFFPANYPENYTVSSFFTLKLITRAYNGYNCYYVYSIGCASLHGDMSTELLTAAIKCLSPSRSVNYGSGSLYTVFNEMSFG